MVIERQVTSPQVNFIEIEAAIKTKLTAIAGKKLVLEQKKAELEAFYFNDDEYKKLEEERKELLKKRKGARQRIMNNKEVYKRHDEVKEMRREVKSSNLMLSDLLLDFEEQSKTNVITDDDGTLLPIVKTAKIAGRT